MAQPAEGTFPPYFRKYIALVKQADIAEAFAEQQHLIDHFFDEIPEDETEYAYAPDKWTIKVLLQHIIDTERILNYRALCIARHEKQSLPGFEEDDYAYNSQANHRKWNSLIAELKIVRQSTIALYQSLPPDAVENSGKSNGLPVAVNALAFITVGHIYHHINIIKERYLTA